MSFPNPYDAPDRYLSQHNGSSEPVEQAVSYRTSSDSSRNESETIKSSTHHDDYDEMPPTLSRKGTTIEDADRRELQRIFTTLSQRRSSAVAPDDPAVDPLSPSFDLSKFLKTMRHQLEAEGIQMHQLGLVYKNLNVFGSGAALQLQQTVADFLQAPLRIGEWFSFGNKERKQILRSFDGVIRSGELLIVLGRPGSGCSTLLKTMCGELHGLELDEQSTVHYNGIPQNRMMKEFKGETVYNQEVCSPGLFVSIFCSF